VGDRIPIVNFDLVIKYFTFFGALLACALTVLRIVDHFKNKPKLSIREGNCFYQYTMEEKTEFIANLELTNVGRRTVVVKDIVAYLLNSRKKELTISGSIFKVDKTLEPNAYHEVDFTLKRTGKMPTVRYFVKAVIRTTHKDYVHNISMVFFDDWVKPLYDWENKRRDKGLLD